MKQHTPRKRFGQNFLTDKNIINKIISAIAAKEQDTVVEIGPGLGAMTTPLMQTLNKLYAVELDRDLVPKLKALPQATEKLHIFEADALAFDFQQIPRNGSKLRIVGNLPYNISTPLLFHLLSYIDYIRDMHFMLQKEVVDRLAAPPGTSNYGRLSVMLQYHCNVTPLFIVKPGCFYPPPKVDSAIVKLEPHQQPGIMADNYAYFSQVVKQAFQQRRKTLKNNLKGLLSDTAIKNCGIDPGIRPEQLSIEAFVALSKQHS